jgi:hypothetical protein
MSPGSAVRESDVEHTLRRTAQAAASDAPGAGLAVLTGAGKRTEALAVTPSTTLSAVPGA